MLVPVNTLRNGERAAMLAAGNLITLSLIIRDQSEARP
jgi:hypothetical protein